MDILCLGSFTFLHRASQEGGSLVKNPTANVGEARDLGLIPRLGRSPGGGSGNPL